MANDNDKKWSQPWNMEEMIENAEYWSLAGDVALLNSIKAYADILLTKTFTISNSVDDLLNNLNNVGLRLDISQNEFQCLRNTQFVESRVYEDDETADFKENFKEEAEDKDFKEEEKQKMIRESILEGLDVIDKYFDKIEVSISDSEDETDKSYVLQSKDFYTDRSLPLVIGTDEWYKKWHVGMEESPSGSESGDISETYSDSDSENALPKDLLKESESSSELDLSSQANGSQPVANSTFDDSVKQPDIFESDESDGTGSLPIKTPISNKNFADQLAEKLGNIISEREDISTEINRKPIQPVRTNKFVDDLFFDEPPPLDDFTDTILPKNLQSDLFSGGNDLFDDNEDESFWHQQSTLPKTKPAEEAKVVIKQEAQYQRQNEDATLSQKSSQVGSKGLFDSDDSSDEDLFVANKKQISKLPFLYPYKVATPLFDEKPELGPQQKKTIIEELVENEPLDTSVKNRRQNVAKEVQIVNERPLQNVISNTSNEGNASPEHPHRFDDDLNGNMKMSPKGIESKKKKISLFDDDDLFKDDLFSKVTSNKLTSNLFDDIENNTEEISVGDVNYNTDKVNLFTDWDLGNKVGAETNQKNPVEPRKVASLFSGNETDGIFNEGLGVSREISDNCSNATKNDTASNENDKEYHKVDRASQLENDDDTEEKYDDMLKTIDTKMIPKKTDVIENNMEPYSERNLGATVPKVQSRGVRESSQSEVTRPTPSTPSNVIGKTDKKNISLFSSSPPPDDEEWDTKSDHFSDTEEQFSYRIDSNPEGLSLFDDEPPSLGTNESSGIVKGQNVTRIDTGYSSFYPHVPSSRYLSDIFNEQQWQDSFFITENKPESLLDIPPQLNEAVEDKKVSNLTITSSSNLENLDYSKEQDSANSLSEPKSQKKEETLYSKPKKSSLFNDNDEIGEYLFSFKTEANALPKLAEERMSSFDTVDLASGKRNETERTTNKIENSQRSANLVEDKVGSIPPLYSYMESKVENILGKSQSQYIEEEEEVPKIGSPGKLKHSLNINVNALLPGSVPPKLKGIPKSQSLDIPKEPEAIPTSASTPDVSLLTPDVANWSEKLSDTSSEKAVSFEDAFYDVEVLPSITKDRARIPVKRRPSTRRGRRETIFKSAADLAMGNRRIDLAAEEQLIEVENNMGVNEPLVKEGSSEKVSQLKSNRTKSIFKSVSIGMEGNKLQDIFYDDPDNDMLVPALSRKDSKVSRTDKSISSIFDSGDSDSDLFSSSDLIKSKQKSKANISVVMKKSLFNDSSSDDDLFMAINNNVDKKKGQLRPSERKAEKPSALRKLKNVETDNDPLSLTLK